MPQVPGLPSLPPINFSDQTAQNPTATGTITGPGGVTINNGLVIPSWAWLGGAAVLALMLVKGLK